MAINQRQRQTSAEWAAGVNAPITAKQAVAKLQEALDYGDAAIDAVMSMLGNMTPPPQTIMPDLYKAREQVVQALGAVKSLEERAPDTNVGTSYVIAGRKLGMELIDQANTAMDKAKTPDDPAKVAAAIAAPVTRVATSAAKGLLSFAGRALTPMEIAFGIFMVDEFFNRGKLRRSLLKGR